MTKQKSDQINRRNFIKTSSLFAVAISMPGIISCRDENTNTPLPVNKDCSNTTEDILGPFYKPGAPFGEDIIPAENTGAPLIVKGNVYGDCDTLLNDAVIEIWNANMEGAYDNATFKFRGQFRTLQDGAYRFKTIIPGRYLNGDTYRPSHIHSALQLWIIRSLFLKSILRTILLMKKIHGQVIQRQPKEFYLLVRMRTA